MKPILTELDFMQECYIRRLYQNNPEMIRKYNYFLNGYQGEKIMYDWLKRNLPAHAIILHDLWFECRGISQIDFLVILNNIIWIIEVKHYNGYFNYQDNVCTLNNYRLDKDHLAQMRNRMLIINDIVKKSGLNIELIGTMIFTHENSEISIPPEQTFDTLTFNQVKQYLSNEILSNTNRSKLSILPHLKKFQTNSTFTMPTLKDSDYTFLKKGVYCRECFSFDLSATDRSFTCQECQFKELKRDALLRQYCCQGVLQHQRPYITTKEIYQLSNSSLSVSYIRKRLKIILQHKLQGKHLSFYNHALPYDKYLKSLPH